MSRKKKWKIVINKPTDLTTAVQALANDYESMGKALDVKHEDLKEEFKKDITQMQEYINSLQETNARLNKELDVNLKETKEIKETVNALLTENDEYKRANDTLNTELVTMKSKLEDLSSTVFTVNMEYLELYTLYEDAKNNKPTRIGMSTRHRKIHHSKESSKLYYGELPKN